MSATSADRLIRRRLTAASSSRTSSSGTTSTLLPASEVSRSARTLPVSSLPDVIRRRPGETRNATTIGQRPDDAARQHPGAVEPHAVELHGVDDDERQRQQHRQLQRQREAEDDAAAHRPVAAQQVEPEHQRGDRHDVGLAVPVRDVDGDRRSHQSTAASGRRSSPSCAAAA